MSAEPPSTGRGRRGASRGRLVARHTQSRFALLSSFALVEELSALVYSSSSLVSYILHSSVFYRAAACAPRIVAIGPIFGIDSHRHEDVRGRDRRSVFREASREHSPRGALRRRACPSLSLLGPSFDALCGSRARSWRSLSVAPVASPRALAQQRLRWSSRLSFCLRSLVSPRCLFFFSGVALVSPALGRSCRRRARHAASSRCGRRSLPSRDRCRSAALAQQARRLHDALPGSPFPASSLSGRPSSAGSTRSSSAESSRLPVVARRCR